MVFCQVSPVSSSGEEAASVTRRATSRSSVDAMIDGEGWALIRQMGIK